MKVKYALEKYINANIGMTEESIIAAEVIDQKVDINQLAKDIAAATPAIDETIAVMVLMNLPKVILKHCLESHTIALGNPMTGEVAINIHPDVKLDWQVTDPQTGKQKSVAFTLSNVKKYLKKDYATLDEAAAEINSSMIRSTLMAEVAPKYVKDFLRDVSLQRTKTLGRATADEDAPSTDGEGSETSGGTKRE